jgi:hypothetical protein
LSNGWVINNWVQWNGNVGRNVAAQLRKRIEARLANHPGLALAGNAYRGVGIPDCIHSGELAAGQVVHTFSSRGLQ